MVATAVAMRRHNAVPSTIGATTTIGAGGTATNIKFAPKTMSGATNAARGHIMTSIAEGVFRPNIATRNTWSTTGAAIT